MTLPSCECNWRSKTSHFIPWFTNYIYINYIKTKYKFRYYFYVTICRSFFGRGFVSSAHDLHKFTSKYNNQVNTVKNHQQDQNVLFFNNQPVTQLLWQILFFNFRENINPSCHYLTEAQLQETQGTRRRTPWTGRHLWNFGKSCFIWVRMNPSIYFFITSYPVHGLQCIGMNLH